MELMTTVNQFQQGQIFYCQLPNCNRLCFCSCWHFAYSPLPSLFNDLFIYKATGEDYTITSIGFWGVFFGTIFLNFCCQDLKQDFTGIGTHFLWLYRKTVTESDLESQKFNCSNLMKVMLLSLLILENYQCINFCSSAFTEANEGMRLTSKFVEFLFEGMAIRDCVVWVWFFAVDITIETKWTM